MIMFFLGVFFVIILGRHYFANLSGSPEEKSELLKWYYLGLVFYIGLIAAIAFMNMESF